MENPWQFGISECMIDRIAAYAAALVKGTGEFTPPWTWADVPAQSTTMSSPAMVTATLNRIGVGRSPSPSIWSWNE